MKPEKFESMFKEMGEKEQGQQKEKNNDTKK